MYQNDMKKGQVGYLKDTGWKFEIMDNKKGNIRLAKVYGLYTELGSIYTSDIAGLIVGGQYERLEQTQNQAKKSARVAELNRALFGE